MRSKPTFLVHFGGRFETVDTRTVIYKDGQSGEIECEAVELWDLLERSIPVTMSSQRVYYKLPYEEMTELRLLWSGGDQFQKLSNMCPWVSVIELYLEEDDSGSQHRQEEAMQDTEEAEPTEAMEANPTEKNTNPLCAEEARVEAVIAEINSEDEPDEEFPSTPIGSDIEEIPDEYEKYVSGSGVLKIRQLFTSLEEFKEGLLEYFLKEGRNIKYARWGPIRSEAICATKGKQKCQWRIYCSYEEPIDAFLVKAFNDEHTCIKDGRCKLLTDNIIAKMFKNDLRTNPDMKPIVIQRSIEEKYNIACSYDQIKNAKRKALAMIDAEYDEQYSKMKDYVDEIRNSNPGSSVELRTMMKDGSKEVFDRFYVCYEALKTAWLASCRPVIGIDGCFLKNGSGLQLLAVVGRDGNNALYPIAWGVVQVEDEINWVWFISKLKEDLQIGNGQGYTLISDKQKGLKLAVEQLLPAVEHRNCARHVYGNICKYHPRRGRFKKLFWNVIQSYTEVDYKDALQKLKEYDIKVYEALMERNPKSCSRAFFKTDSICEDALNNHSESYNHTLEKARAMPLVEMLETMRRQAMVRIEMRRVKAMNHKPYFCPRVAKLISKEEAYKKDCKIFPGPAGLFEVSEQGTAYKVNMNLKTCTCRRWDLTGVPCRHSLRVIMDRNLVIQDYVAKVFSTKLWQKQYSYNIKPLQGTKFWKASGEPTLEAPARVVERGRRKKPRKRIKGVNEDKKKGGKKTTTHCRIMYCQKCGFPGHLANYCKNPGVLKKPSKKKLAEMEAAALAAEMAAAEEAGAEMDAEEMAAAEEAGEEMDDKEEYASAAEEYMSATEGEEAPQPTQPTQDD